MTDLGHLLELIHDAHTKVSTLEAEYRDWLHTPAAGPGLLVEYSDGGKPRPRWREDGPFSTTFAATRGIWLHAPDRLRVEVIYPRGLAGLGVRNGSRWWRWDRVNGAISGEVAIKDGRTNLPVLLSPPLIDPVSLLSELRFQYVGSGSRAGREVVLARARRRGQEGPAEPDLIELELEFDAEHGTILRRATVREDTLLSVTEAVEVVYGRPVEAGRFLFVPPEGSG